MRPIPGVRYSVIYQFDQCRIDTERFQLQRQGEAVAVEPLVFDLLLYLIEHRDRVVGRAELLDALWAGKVVSDAALAARLKDARKAVGDSGSRQAIIKTFHGRGYQFVAEVTQPDTPGSATASAEQPYTVDLSLPEDPSVAVLTFSNLSGEPAQAIFCEGITDDITTSLSRVPGLFVIARQSVRDYAVSDVDPQRVGREQGVRYVLQGSVQFAGERVRVSAQLVDTRSGRHRWAERFDSDSGDFLDLQDEITAKIVVALQVTLTDGEQARLSAGGTSDLAAWEATQRAKKLVEMHVREDNLQAQQLLREALQRDPQFATAWALLGWTQWEINMWGWGSGDEDLLQQARISAQKALQLDDFNPEGLALSIALNLNSGDLDAVTGFIDRGVAAHPSHSFLLAMSAVGFRAAGRIDEAFRLIKRAIRLCPIYPAWYLMVLGSLHIFKGEAQQAVTILQTVVNRDPESNMARVWLVIALAEAGEAAAAKRCGAEVLRLQGGFSAAHWLRGLGLHSATTAQRLLSSLAAADLPA